MTAMQRLLSLRFVGKMTGLRQGLTTHSPHNDKLR
jgi:hypothetical protein